jgi:hypothetical protein
MHGKTLMIDSFRPPGTPVAVGAKVKYQLQESTGALLVADGNVTHNQLTPDACDNARAWFIKNAEDILIHRKITKEKGIWVITKTYTAKRRAVALLHARESSVEFAVNVKLTNAGKLAPEASWWSSQKEQAWKIASPVSYNAFKL